MWQEHARQRREIRVYLTNQNAQFDLVSRIMKFVVLGLSTAFNESKQRVCLGVSAMLAQLEGLQARKDVPDQFRQQSHLKHSADGTVCWPEEQNLVRVFSGV